MKMIRENKGNFFRCVCKSSRKAAETNPRCAEDLAAVASLPDHWIPQRSGPTLINYLKEREDNYKASLCSMSKDTAVVNNDIGKKICELAELLYAHCKDYHRDTKGIISDFSIAKDKSHIACDLALEEITKIYDQGIQEIEQFKNNILILEHLRSDKLKLIFRNKFNKLVSVDHYTPNNILSDFDEHVCGLNDQLLTNLKAYLELVAQLHTHLDEIITYARSVLNQLCLTPPNSFADNPDVNDGGKLLFSNEGDDLDIKKIVTCLIDACQGTVSKLCTELFNHLDHLEKNICISNFDVKSIVLSDLEKITEDGLLRISDCCTQYDTLEFDDPISIDDIKKILSVFNETLFSSYSVLYDSCHLINAPVVRLAQAQKLTLVQLEEIQTNNDVIELSNEIGFNIVLEQMRGAPDVEKVQNQFDILTNLLIKQDNLYFQHTLNEVDKSKDFLNFVWQVIDMLYSECSYYLNAKFNNLYSSNEKITSELDFIVQSFERIQEFLPRTILQSQDHNTSLSNWNNKFLTSLDAKKQMLRDILVKQGHKWMEEKCLIFNIRYSLKTMSHTVRMERVIAARDARIKEIRLHESGLKFHLDTMNHLIETLPTEAFKFIDFDSKELYPLTYWATQIQNNITLLLGQSGNSIDELFQINSELKSMKLLSYGLRLRKYRQHFDDSLESACKLYKRNVELRIHSAKISNFNFMQQITLFNEGGTYATAEAIKTNAVLVKTADALVSCTTGTMNAVNRCQANLMMLADEMLSPMMQIINNSTSKNTVQLDTNKKIQAPTKK